VGHNGFGLSKTANNSEHDLYRLNSSRLVVKRLREHISKRCKPHQAREMTKTKGDLWFKPGRDACKSSNQIIT